MAKTIPLAWTPWPAPDAAETQAVVEVLRSGRVNQWTGDRVRTFERRFADFHGVPYAVAVMNGTVALELALRAMGIGPGDDVVTSCRTFIASASAAVAVGARPVLADVDRESGNVTAETVEAALTPRTKAIIPVHLGGWPCEMDPILELARSRGLFVIEDCAQAHGGSLDRRPLGSFGHAAAFSFCQDKIMTTGGEGGMLLTRDEDLWRRAWSYKDHGKDLQAAFEENPTPGFRWIHHQFGTNWRMTEMQAAIGLTQLAKLPEWHARRKSNAERLTTRLRRSEMLRVPIPAEGREHAYYKLYVYVRPRCLRREWSRDRIMTEVEARGVPCQVGICPEIYLERAFRNRGWALSDPLPVARELGENALMLQVHPTLGTEHMETAADTLEDVLRSASR